MGDDFDIECINREQGVVVANTGEIADEVVFFDEESVECEPETAVYCRARFGDKVVYVDLSAFDIVATRH